MVMIMWGVIAWWYTEGWQQCLSRVKSRLVSTLDYFSFGMLLITLFNPFRQISAGSIRGSFEMQLRAFGDRLLSRCVGAVVRLAMLLIGAIALLLNVTTGVVILIGWLFVPLLPFVGLALSLAGWLPWVS